MRNIVQALAGAALLLLLASCTPPTQNASQLPAQESPAIGEALPQDSAEGGIQPESAPAVAKEPVAVAQKGILEVSLQDYRVDLFRFAPVPQDIEVNAVSEFYLFGWSRDGKIAYADASFYDMRGTHDARFVIMDLVTDKVVWSAYKESEEGFPTEAFLREKAPEIDANLRAAGIEFSVPQYRKFPMEGIPVAVTLDVRRKNDDEMEKLISLLASRNGRAKTVVEPFDAVAEDAFLCGYVQSPFEPRALIVYAHSFAFEGCNIQYHLAGCHLTAGF